MSWSFDSVPSGSQKRAAVFCSFGLTGTKSLDRPPDGACRFHYTLDDAVWFPHSLFVNNSLNSFHLIFPGGMGFLVS